jgi:hypothetical protein
MRKFIFIAFLLIASITVIAIENQPGTELVFHIGKAYEQVVQDSSFPVATNTAFSSRTPSEADSTWFNRRKVIIRFDDPDHGFTLPPTKFGAIGYWDGKVTTLRTSPMLEKLPFEQAFQLLNKLQNTFKEQGWTLKQTEYNRWLNSSNAGKKALQASLFEEIDQTTLIVPGKYRLVLIMKCSARCNEKNNSTARYLIDIGIGEDI